MFTHKFNKNGKTLQSRFHWTEQLASLTEKIRTVVVTTRWTQQRRNSGFSRCPDGWMPEAHPVDLIGSGRDANSFKDLRSWSLKDIYIHYCSRHHRRNSEKENSLEHRRQYAGKKNATDARCRRRWTTRWVCSGVGLVFAFFGWHLDALCVEHSILFICQKGSSWSSSTGKRKKKSVGCL